MNNIIKKYKAILPLALFVLGSQSLMAQEVEGAQGDTINVAFRKADARDVITPVSTVNVKNLMEKNYYTSSLDGMQALTAGYNGQLWNMGEALVIVDGVPRDADNVLPSEIEDITFLKGASAVVLYGSRAAKGAILITTKRGSVKPLETRIRADYQLLAPKAYPTYLGAAEYMTYYNQALANDGLSAIYTDEQIYHTAAGTNPYRYPNLNFFSSDYLKKTTNRWDVSAEFEGGGKFAQFYTNISYNRQGDLVNFGEAKKNYTDRLSVLGNIDLQLADWATAWVNAKATYQNSHSGNGDFWGAATTLRPNRVAPLIPISMVDPNDAAAQTLIANSKNLIDGMYLLGGTQEDQTNAIAAMYAAGYTNGVNRQMNFDAGVNFDLGMITPGLSFKAHYAVDYKTSYTLSLNDAYETYGVSWTNINGKDAIGSLTKYGKYEHSGILNSGNGHDRQTMAFSGQFDYKRTFAENHNLHATVLANGYQITNDGEYHRISNANLGVQASYNYAHKYYADLGMNVVHSAKLPEGNREALSPSLTLGWRLSEDINADWLDDLRLTAGYTVLNQDLDIAEYYMYENIFTATGTWWGWNNDHNSIQTSDSQRGGNDKLTFVKRKELNIGLNGKMWNAFNFSVNFFHTFTDGLLAQPDYVYPSYFHTYYPVSTFVPYINYGQTSRTGVDFSLGYNKQINNDLSFAVEAHGMTTTSKNERVAENVEFDYMATEGKVTDALWGLECLGYYNSQSEIDADPAKSSFGTVKPGDLRYKDQNGDNIIDSKDRVVLGQWGAKFNGGLNLTLKYKKFTLFTLLTCQFGGNALKSDTYNQVFGDRKYSDVVRGAWTAEKYAAGEAITYPRLTTDGNASGNNWQASDYWMYKTDRIDLGRVQLTYDIDKSILGQKSLVNRVQVYLSGSNLLTFSGEREQMERNIGYGPQMRTFTLGAKVEF